ncbi:MAG: (d)CMP kinase [Bacillota bacterium]
MKNISIAIDGPAGAGKSTIAKSIARIKKLTYIDTGAMYRAIALKIMMENIDITSEQSIIEMMKRTKIDMLHHDVFLDNELVNDKIRKPEVSSFVSHVARLKAIRERMVELQQKIAREKDIIMDGRDIGTAVLPDATYKFFLTATIDERAKRRFLELKENGHTVDFEAIKSDIATRDKIDSEREIDPLRPAEDAIIIDTTGLTIEQVVDKILSYIQ